MSFSLNQYDKPIRLTLFCVSAVPFIWMLYHYNWGDLGINPFETLMEVSGHAALIFLTLSLTITPLRRWLTALFTRFKNLKWGKRLSDWNVLIRSRRMLGLYSFFYASLHIGIYMEFELSWLFEELVWEIKERNFIVLGLIAWIILILLSITSPKVIQRKMKRWWRRLHRLAYPLSILACLHYLWATKETDITPYYYIVSVTILLGHRFIVMVLPMFKRPDDTGMESNRSKTTGA